MKILTTVLTSAALLTGCATASMTQQEVRSPNGTYKYNLVSATSTADLGGGPRMTSTILLGDDGSVSIIGTASGEMAVNSAMPSAMLGASGVIAAKLISDGNQDTARINAEGRARAAQLRGPENVITVEGSRAYADSVSETGDSIALGGDAFALNDDNSREYTDVYTRVDTDNSRREYNEYEIEIDGDMEIEEINVDEVNVDDVRIYND